VKRRSWLYVVVVLAVVVLVGLAYVAARQHRAGARQSVARTSSAASRSPAALAPQLSGLAHIFVILEENKSYSEIVNNSTAPYINGLIKRYALPTNYHALFHPSLPNYIALTSGSNHGITDDRSPPSAGNEIAVPNIADRIEASGRTWKEYAESIPSPGYAFDSGEYVTKHVPFVYYRDIVGESAEMPHSRRATDATGHRPAVGEDDAGLRLHHAQPLQRHARLPDRHRRPLAGAHRAPHPGIRGVQDDQVTPGRDLG
jgi:Phosphoesterase family.